MRQRSAHGGRRGWQATSWLPPNRQAKVDFATQIEPILREQCYECHGEKKGRGKLRLHVRDLALKGGATGPLLVAGDSAKSYMVQRLLGEGGEDQMPLDKDPLSAEQTALIRAWIDQGAEWPATPGATPGAAPTQTVEEHWAYVKPRRPRCLPCPTRRGLARPSIASSWHDWTPRN